MVNNNKTILVVDDDEGILDAFKTLLEDEDYHVLTSPDGEILYNSIDMNTTPDLIILDVLLSGKDGREICKFIKKDGKLKGVPVIMTSAHPNIDESVIKSGANDYLPKPFNIDDLLNKVKEHLQ